MGDNTRPCYMCNERSIGCHSTCKRYLSCTEENNKRKEMIRKAKFADKQVNDFRKQQVEKAIRRRG